MDLMEALREMTSRCLSQAEIMMYLNELGIPLTRRQVKYQIKKFRLDRNQRDSDACIRQAIREELEAWTRCTGYRTVWKNLRSKGYKVQRERVRKILQEEDPIGVANRSRRRFKRGMYRSVGPNEVWHVDGNDKLGPFGIYISGCIDGYSRKLMWLKAGCTNSNPKVISSFFLDCIENVGGCPLKLRADAGTENPLMATMQMFLLRNAISDVEQCVIIGKSTRNQRIEQFWSHLLKDWTEWWRHFLASVPDFDKKNHLDRSLMQFCFMNIIQKELDDYRTLWNDHRIRHQQGLHIPTGKPNLLYDFPEVYGGNNMLQEVDDADVFYLKPYSKNSSDVEDPSLNLYFNYILLLQDIPIPTTPFEGFVTYQFIKRKLT